MSEATIVALDTATPDVAVAAVRGEQVLAERWVAPEPGGRPRAGTALLPAVEAIVSELGGWEAVGRIGVGLGPGSFTGLRIGIATARALAQGVGVPIAGVGSLAALARGALGANGTRCVLAVIDARRGEAFAALHAVTGEEAWPPFVAAPDELVERLAELRQPPLAVGDGSVRFRAELEAAGAEVPPDGALHRLAARHVAWLAAEAEPTGPDAIEPIYLRRPDAELWRERIHEGSGPERSA